MQVYACVRIVHAALSVCVCVCVCVCVPCGLVGSRLFGRRGCEPGIPPGGWLGMRRAGRGPPGYRGDMKGWRESREEAVL